MENKINHIMKYKNIVAGLAAGLVALAVAGCATEKSQAKITKEQAEQTALAKAPGGTIKEAELEKEKDKLIWSFDISGSPGVTEVNVDAITGEVVGVENESPGKEAKEKN
jgi:uncharacterized membrane protein YkoI